jgi:hypothetical protein
MFVTIFRVLKTFMTDNILKIFEQKRAKTVEKSGICDFSDTKKNFRGIF